MLKLAYILFLTLLGITMIEAAIEQKIQNVQGQKNQQKAQDNVRAIPFKSTINVNTQPIVQDTKNQEIAQNTDPQSVSQRQAWTARTKFVSFESTIQNFQYLKQSIKVENLIKFAQSDFCLFGQMEPFRIAILNNKFYIYGNRLQIRHVRIIREAFEKIFKNVTFPDLYFYLFAQDSIPDKYDKKERENCIYIPMFMFNKNVQSMMEQNKFLFPDIYVLQETWPNSVKASKKASAETPWQSKINKLFFVGAQTGHGPYIRNDTDFNKYYHRGALTLMSLKYPDIIYARLTGNDTDLSKQTFRRSGNNPQIFSRRKTIADHVKNRYLVSPDGYASAWSRPAFIMFSNSLLFKTNSPNMQWFYDKMIPDVNFVQIKDDLSNLFSKREYFQKNPAKAAQISKNANSLAEQYLTPEAILQYIIEVLNKYAKIQQMSLTQQQKSQVQKGLDIHQLLVKKYQGDKIKN